MLPVVSNTLEVDRRAKLLSSGSHFNQLIFSAQIKYLVTFVSKFSFVKEIDFHFPVLTRENISIS